MPGVSVSLSFLKDLSCLCFGSSLLKCLDVVGIDKFDGLNLVGCDFFENLIALLGNDGSLLTNLMYILNVVEF